MRAANLILFAVSCAVLLICVDFTAANIALVTIQKEFQVGISEVQWILNGYFLVFAALMVAGGRLGDIYGRKKAFITGTTIFGLASLGCGLSPGVWWVIGFRALQGLGGALMWPSASVLAFTAYPPEKRGAAVGVIMGTAGLAQAVGPLLGGVLTQELSWRWIFLINVPISLATVVMAAIFVSEKKKRKDETIDYGGIVTMAVALFCLIWALDNANKWGWISKDFLGVSAVAAASLLLFRFIERKVKDPLLPPGFFRDRQLVGTFAARMCMCFGWFIIIFLLGLYFQNVKNLDPLRSGLSYLPLSLSFGILSPFGGRIIDRLGARRPILAGLLGFVVSFGLYSQVTVASPIWLISIPSVVIGMSCALVSTGLATEVLNLVPEEKQATASGTYYMLTLIGGTLGIAVTGYMLGREGGGRLLGLLSSEGVELSAGQQNVLGGLLSGTKAAEAELHSFSGPLLETVKSASDRAFVGVFSSIALICLGLSIAALVISFLVTGKGVGKPPDEEEEIYEIEDLVEGG